MRTARWATMTLATAFSAVAAPASAQVQTTFHGEVRPRYEFRDPLGGGPDEFTSMRVRLGLEAMLDADLSVFAQLQDVRVWGEETNPLFDYRADNLDLHQGYLRFRGDRFDWLTATVGRMEATFGEERLVGPVGWAQQGQSFDGVRLDVDQAWGTLAIIAYRIGDDTAPSVGVDSEFYGAYGTVPAIGPGDVDVYWLYDREEGATETDQHSLGARYVFTVAGDIEGRVEGTFQTGTRDGSSVSAYMLGARAGKSFLEDRVGVTLWYDYVSGDDPSTTETEVFHTLFGTNHKFYGLADVFLNLPVHTAGAGLQDMAVKLSWQARDDTSLAADLHSFRAAERGTLSGSHFGDEIDLTASHRYSQHLTVVTGFSYVLQDDPLAEIGRLSEDLKWLYVMLSAAF